MVAALFILAVFQDSAGDVLKPGQAEGVIKENSPLLETLSLESRGVPAGSVKAESFSVRVPSAGSWTLEMKSYSFDSYLVLRDSSGKVLAENDDGPVGLHARLVFQANQDSQLQVDAGCIWEGAGPFTLELRQGRPADLNPVALAEARIVDGEAWISYQRDTQGPWIALAMEQTGRFCREAGRLGKAESMAREALLLWEKKLGSEHPKIGEAWLDLGRVLIDQGRGELARQAFEEALERYAAHRSPGSNDLLSIQGSIAEAWILMGRYARAEGILRPSLESARFATDANLFLVPGLEDALGRTLQFQGAVEEARPFFESALRAREVFADQDPTPFLWSLNNLGLLEQETGAIDAARVLYEEALSSAISLLGQTHPLTLQVRNNLATVMRMEGNLEEAEKELGEIHRVQITTLGENHHRAIETKISLAVLRDALGKWEAAKADFESLRLVLESASYVHPKRLVLVWSNLASVLARLGHSEAGPLFRKTLEYAREELGENHPQTSFARIRFAGHLLSVGDADEAVALAQIAEDSLDGAFGPGHPYGVVARHFLARARILQGNPAAAWEVMASAVQAASDYLVRLYAHLPEPDRIRVTRGFHSSLHLLLSLARLLPERQEEAFIALLDSRGRIHRTFSDWGPVGEDAKDLVDELIRIQGEISTAVLGKVGRDLVAEKQALSKLHEQRLQLEREILRLQPPSSLERRPDFAAIRGSLPLESSLILFSVHPVLETDGWHPARAEAWVLTSGGNPKLIDLGPADSLRRMIKEMTGGYRGAEAIEGVVRDVRQELYSVLWEPIKESLGKSDLVFLSPDSFLSSFPFEVLQSKEGRFLLEDYRFVYLPDPSALAQASQSELSGESLLSVGGVLYQAAQEGDSDVRAAAPGVLSWKFLPATKPEAIDVHEFHDERFPGGERVLLIGAEADEARIKESMQRASFLHLATHGHAERISLRKVANPLWKMDGDDAAEALLEEKQRAAAALPGLLSFLVLAGANDSVLGRPNDGYLTAEEVSFLNLEECRVAVLSACMAAFGQNQADEGMTSLQRGFLRAGARRVISTLWKVEDVETRDLMSSFYSRMWQYNASPLDALTGARRELLNQQRDEGEIDSRTWGAFIFSGDWR